MVIVGGEWGVNGGGRRECMNGEQVVNEEGAEEGADVVGVKGNVIEEA